MRNNFLVPCAFVLTRVHCIQWTAAEEIFETFTLPEHATVKAVVRTFDQYFMPKVNTFDEKAVFHSQCQEPTETVAAYTRAFCELSKNAEFPDREKAIRNRLAIGLLDNDLSKKLQLQANLALADLTAQAR